MNKKNNNPFNAQVSDANALNGRVSSKTQRPERCYQPYGSTKKTTLQLEPLHLHFQAACERNPLLRAALEYAAEGLHVLPLAPLGTANLVPVHEASNDPVTIRAWWAQWPNANIGIATGNPGGRR